MFYFITTKQTYIFVSQKLAKFTHIFIILQILCLHAISRRNNYDNTGKEKLERSNFVTYLLPSSLIFRFAMADHIEYCS